MIGVPASTPKTPTLVIVNVPAAHLRRLGPALARRTRQGVDRRAQLGQRQRVGALDVGHDQPARGGGRDAEVHVGLEHDLLGRLVPGRVDLLGAAHRQADRLGHHEQRGHLDVAELAVRLELLDELHRPGDVDGDPLGDVRGRERGVDHRLRHHLPHALDRLAPAPADLSASDVVGATLSALTTRRRGPDWRAWTSSRVTVPSGPVGVRVRRSTPRSLASLRTGGFASTRTSTGGRRRLVRPAGVAGTAGSSASTTSAVSRRALAERTLELQLRGRPGLGRRARAAAAGTALDRRGARAVADERLVLAAAGRGRVGHVDLGCGHRRGAGLLGEPEVRVALGRTRRAGARGAGAARRRR